MHARTHWRPETTDMFSAVSGAPAARRYLVVERLPGGGWDWVTWDEPARPLYGQADNLDQAMREAERAVIVLDRRPTLRSGFGHAI